MVQTPALSVQTSALFARRRGTPERAGVCTTVSARRSNPSGRRAPAPRPSPASEQGGHRPMGPGRFTTYPPRVWTVDIVTGSGRPAATCRLCGPLEHADTAGGMLHGTVLRHLARHARSDLTPTHLRTCQCGRRGCPWHPRRCRCSGPVQLALTRTSVRSWRLTDSCSRCSSVTPHTAAVPEPAPPGRPETGPSDVTVDQDCERADQSQVWDTACMRCGMPSEACWWTHCIIGQR
jgi:hypothetical protein